MFRFLDKIGTQHIEQKIVTVDGRVERLHDERYRKIIYVIMLIVVESEEEIIVTVVLEVVAISLVPGYKIDVILDGRGIFKTAICQIIQQFTHDTHFVAFLLLVYIAQRSKDCLEIVLIAIYEKFHLIIPYRIAHFLK